MNGQWPKRRAAMIGLPVRIVRQLCNHDGPVKAGTMGTITGTFSFHSFSIAVGECGCCGVRRRVKYVTPADVELLA
jgi:hypothetical protein